MRLPILIATCLMMLLTVPAKAVVVMGADELYDFCDEKSEGFETNKYVCMAYIHGNLDTMEVMTSYAFALQAKQSGEDAGYDAFAKQRDRMMRERDFPCVPVDVQISKLPATYTAYMRENPGLANAPAHLAFRLAMQQVFPCK